MSRDRFVLIPQIRSLAYFPPVITWVNFLTARGFRFVILAHQIARSSFDHPEAITFVEITGKPYPTSYVGKAWLKAKARVSLWKVLRAHTFELVWVCVWDFRFLKLALDLTAFKGKLVYHFLELDPANFKFCRQADHVIVPEENRAWLTYFMARLPRRPWVLPNIPVLAKSTQPLDIPYHIRVLIDAGKIIVFYSGLIDFEKRCLNELISAIAQLDERFHLILMPGKSIEAATMTAIETRIHNLGAAGKVHLIESVPAPHHLNFFRIATVGIGLYRPTSLNQVYAAPNRIYEFSAFGIPVILPHFPQFISLQDKYPFGVVTADPEDVGDIRRKIEIFGDLLNLEHGRTNSGRFFADNANYAEFAERILALIHI